MKKAILITLTALLPFFCSAQLLLSTSGQGVVDPVTGDTIMVEKYIYSFEADSASRITIPDEPQLRISGDLTISFWINLDSANSLTNSHIISRSGTASDRRSWVVRMSPGGTGQLTFGIWVGNVFKEVTSTSSLTDLGGWNNVVCQHFASSGNIRIYINNVANGVTSAASSGLIDVEVGPTVIGAQDGGTNYFDGKLYDVQVWAAAWTLEDRDFYKNEYRMPTFRGGTSLQPSDLRLHLKMGEQKGSLAFDASGYDNHGTIDKTYIHKIDNSIPFYLMLSEGYLIRKQGADYYADQFNQEPITSDNNIFPALDFSSCLSVAWIGPSERWPLDDCPSSPPPANQPPVVNAGQDKNLVFPNNSTTFTAAASDVDGFIASYLWENVSNTTATLSGVTTNVLTITNAATTTHTFKVTVTDNQGAIGEDFVNLTVQGAPTFSNSAYYISTTGNDNNAGTFASPWRTITKANNTITAGDTVFIRGGTYNQAIAPTRNGAAGRYITYKAYPGESVTISNVSTAANLTGRQYIAIDSIRFNGGALRPNASIDTWMAMSGTQYCIIRNCNFKYANGYYGILMENGAKFNWFFRCAFDFCGTWDKTGLWRPSLSSSDNGGNPAADNGDLFAIHNADMNLIERCEFRRGGHDLFAVDGSLNIIRNNLFDNSWDTLRAPGYTKKIGQRAMVFTARSNYNDSGNKNQEGAGKLNVLEGNTMRNTFWFSDVYANRVNMMIKLQGVGQLLRGNLFHTGYGPAMNSRARTPTHHSSRHAVYNNVFTGMNLGVWSVSSLTDSDNAFKTLRDNRFFNNLMYDNKLDDQTIFGTTETTLFKDIYYNPNPSQLAANGNINNKWFNNLIWNPSASENVSYNSNTALTFPTAQTNFPNNFSGNIVADPLLTGAMNNRDPQTWVPNAGSPLIGAGAPQANVTASVSGATVISVDNTYAFFSRTRRLFNVTYTMPNFSGTINNDQILVNGQVREIVSINHDAGTITLNTSTNVTAGNPVYLYNGGVAWDNIGAKQ